MKTTLQHEEKFKGLLYELFQFDSVDPDFGIFHRVKRESWDSAHMIYKPLDRHDANFQNCTVKVSLSKTGLIKAI